MRLATKLLGIALWLVIPPALAQKILGDLLDSGAKKLAGDEVKQELVQRVIVGPTATGGNIELMYVSNGLIQGKGNNPQLTGSNVLIDLSGDWTIEDSGKFCTSMRIAAVGPSGGINRCQFWFKYKDQYFLADSDTDRQARVLRRTIKQ